jgi:hypothetical protein
MFTINMPRISARGRSLAMLAVTAAMISNQAAADPVVLLAPPDSVKKVANGKFAADVDNGWVIYQGFAGQPTLSFYDSDSSGNFKLKTPNLGLNSTGLLFNAGGIVFAPCPVATGTRCSVNDAGESGVGVGFGQATFGGAGGAAGGWVNDSKMAAYVTNPNQGAGSIAAAAVDATNGAFAVGWDLDLATFANHAILWKLNSANKTYAPVSKTDMGTLGGRTSQALAISKNAKYIAGIADTAANKKRAVYALTSATAWTDITTGFPGEVIKSRALAASDSGFIAGSATVKRVIGGKKKSVDIGFVYNTADGTVKFFEAAGFNVNPLKVLNDGRVVGNLEMVATGAIKANHPFIFNGTNLVDFGTMVLGATGQPAFGCRVNRPNNLGELAGSCIPNSNTPYGVGGAAFYIDAASVSPVFIDVNAAIHANTDANTPSVRAYTIGSVTSIDDQHEITVMAVRYIAGNPNLAGFLASKPAYNP